MIGACIQLTPVRTPLSFGHKDSELATAGRRGSQRTLVLFMFVCFWRFFWIWFFDISVWLNGGSGQGFVAPVSCLPGPSDPPAHCIPTPGSRSIDDLGAGWFATGPGDR